LQPSASLVESPSVEKIAWFSFDEFVCCIYEEGNNGVLVILCDGTLLRTELELVDSSTGFCFHLIEIPQGVKCFGGDDTGGT
jgi:hypothetical protein